MKNHIDSPILQVSYYKDKILSVEKSKDTINTHTLKNQHTCRKKILCSHTCKDNLYNVAKLKNHSAAGTIFHRIEKMMNIEHVLYFNLIL